MLLLFSFFFPILIWLCCPECSDIIIAENFPFINTKKSAVFMIAQHIFYLVIRSIDNYSWKITKHYRFKCLSDTYQPKSRGNYLIADTRFVCWCSFFYRPKRSFGQGNVFTGVCDSVHRGGGGMVWGGWGWYGPGGGPPNFRGGGSNFFGRGRVSTGIRSTFGRGTHPTGMHSFYVRNCFCFFVTHKVPGK